MMMVVMMMMKTEIPFDNDEDNKSCSGGNGENL